MVAFRSDDEGSLSRGADIWQASVHNFDGPIRLAVSQGHFEIAYGSHLTTLRRCRTDTGPQLLHFPELLSDHIV